jgi:hypothetical protein
MMPRNTTPEFNARLDAQVTSTGYLIRLESPGMQTLQLCDIGSIAPLTLGGFAGEDVTVSNAGSEQASISVQNLNGAFGAYLLNANPLASIVATIWQVERGAPDSPVMLGVYAAESADIGLDRASLRLRLRGMKTRWAPSRRINAANGFRHALRPGEVFLWGSQRVLIKERGN